MAGTEFKGVGPALVTPMNVDGEVDFDSLSNHVEEVVDKGVHFLVPCGTTGESATLSPAEQKAVITRTVEVAKGRVPVLAGAGSNATPYTLDLAIGAREAGADGVLIVTPYYNKPSPRGLALHFSRIAEAGLPMVLYNVPGRTGSNVLPQVVMDLVREVPSIVGIKEAAGDLSQFMDLLALSPEGFVVLSGDDDLALPSMAVGGHGVISVVANEDPAGLARMAEAAMAGDMETARREHFRLLPLMKANFLESNPGPVKAAMELLGRFEGRIREPMASVTDGTRSRIQEALQAADLLEPQDR